MLALYHPVSLLYKNVITLYIIDNCDASHQNPFNQTISGATGSNPARIFSCRWYCFNTSILVLPGSVIGVIYTDIIAVRGQMLAQHTQQTTGICLGQDIQYSSGIANEVTCSTTANNNSITLLAGASIGKLIIK